MLVSLDRDWGDPADKIFSVTSVGVIFNQWGVKPPTPRQIERWLYNKTYHNCQKCGNVGGIGVVSYMSIKQM